MEIVSYEIAKKLKEKGFRELCTHFYRNGTSTPQEMFCGLRSNTHHKWAFNSMEVKLKDTHERVQVNMIDAPTISQVLKWLREECGIFIIVEPDILSPGYKITFTPRVKFYIKGEEDEGFSEYLTYRRDSHELATLAGIEYAIDNLI